MRYARTAGIAGVLGLILLLVTLGGGMAQTFCTDDYCAYLPLLTKSEPIPTPTSTPPASDSEPPDVVEFTFEPDTVNASWLAQDVYFTLRIVDDLSGIRPGYHYGTFRGPEGRGLSFIVMTDLAHRVSGNERDGVYLGYLQIPQYTEIGAWQFEQLRLDDNANHVRMITREEFVARGFPITITVTSGGAEPTPIPGPDLDPPRIVSVDIDPEEVDLSQGDQVVQLTMRFEDDATGLHWGSIEFAGPSKRHRAKRYFNSPATSDFPNCVTFDSGLHATCYANLLIQRHSERGTWRLDYLDALDGIGNVLLLHYEDLPLEFEVR